MVWFGLGLPTTCFIICVKAPETRIAEKINSECVFNLLQKLEYCSLNIFFESKEKAKKTDEASKYQTDLPNSVILIKNSLKYIL